MDGLLVVGSLQKLQSMASFKIQMHRGKREADGFRYPVNYFAIAEATPLSVIDLHHGEESVARPDGWSRAAPVP